MPQRNLHTSCFGEQLALEILLRQPRQNLLPVPGSSHVRQMTGMSHELSDSLALPMLKCSLPAVRMDQQAAERNAQELLATEAQSKSHPEGEKKKGKKKKKVHVLRCL